MYVPLNLFNKTKIIIFISVVQSPYTLDKIAEAIMVLVTRCLATLVRQTKYEVPFYGG